MAKKPSTNESEELFETIGRDVLLWLDQAQELMMAADTILPELLKTIDSYPSQLGVQKNRRAFVHSYMLLVGLAFENLIKGILIGRNQALVDKKKIESGILERKGHGIAKGAKDIFEKETAILRLTDNQFRLLKRVEEYLVWAGRYPLPIKSGQYHASEEQELRSWRTDDPETINLLFEKLVDVLEK